jgi:hypothetical protein
LPTHVPGNRLWQILFVLMALETGFFLIIVPWSPAWDHNLVMTYFASLRPLLESDYARGAVSGLGLVNLWVGLAEATKLPRRGGPAPERESAAQESTRADAPK